MKVLTSIIERGAKKFPDKPALTMRIGYRTVTLSYADVYEMACKVALFLQQQGLGKDDKVLLLAPNSPYWPLVFFGSQLNGSIPVPLNTQSTAEQIKRVADQTEAKIIFAHSFFRQELSTRLKRYNIELLPELVDQLNLNDFKTVEIKPTDLAQILYTSGTTGDPKGVMLTHANIYSNLTAISQVIALRGHKDRLLSILPLSHVLEQVIGLMLPLMHGAHIIYAHTPAAIRMLMHQYHITKMVAVPEFLQILMSRIEEKAEQKSKKKLLERMMRFSLKLNVMPISRLLFWPVRRVLGGKLDTVSSGGAPLNPELEKKWNALGIYLLQGYGLTETSPTVTTNTYKERRFGSVGKVLQGVQVKLADDGEIWVKGPNVFQGYYKNKEKTDAALTSDGWFKTTDQGEFDQDGFLYIRGRKKYVIIGPGGQNVFPEDIEWELKKVAGVKDSAVIGIPREHGMIEIHAILLLDDPALKPEEVVKTANEHLASYQQVAGWTVWPDTDFPRSATRKVQKEKVKEYLKQHEEKGGVPKPIVKVSPLIKLLSHITGVEVAHIHMSTKIVSELQLDSLRRVELVARIEEDFAVEIDEVRITSTTTVEQLQDMIDKQEPIKAPPKLKRWPRSWWAHALRPLGQYLLYFILRPFVKLEVHGQEHLKDLKLPVIFMPNHTSYLDPTALTMALPWKIRKNISFSAAQDVLYGYYRYLAWFADLFFNTFVLPRKEGENIKLGLNNTGQMLDKGYSVVIFPEGLISPDGKLQELKGGAGLIALSMDTYVVPVKIEGAAKIMPYAKFIPRARGTVSVTFGKPIKFSKAGSYADATQKIYQELKKL